MTSRTGNRRSERRTAPAARAFTLVELLLVMAILVVVVGLALPSLGGFFRGRTVDSEARRLLALMRQAQSRAVFEGVPMRLWVDGKSRCYGLEEEPGYSDLDTKAVEFTVHEDLGLEFTNPKPAPLTTASATAKEAAKAILARSRSPHRTLPAIRFLPDGSLDENSPPALRVYDRNGGELWLSQAEDRLNYEIRSRTNQWDEASR
jgi:type II secretion system protein H